ncbi:MAG: hypothetical protein HY738_17655 [Bacteroidia bacterium]|nr:hypothetical protein [Bacteroidia bacterium]
MKKYSILMKFAAVFTALNIFIDTVLPYHVFALTGGPSSPEFSSFEPVATTNMVNEFTGDFTYNLPILQIPGPDGGGYAMSLSYHTGASPEEEASWVGYGWTLNPGAINRCKKGIPDDWNGLESEFWNKTRPNKTICAGTGTAAEIYSWSFGTNGTLRYNNYKGMGYVVSTYFGNRGIGSLGYTYSDGEGSFSWQINPAGLLEQTKDEQSEKDKSLREMVQDKDLKAAQSMKKVVNRTPSLTAPHLDIKAMAGSKYGIMSLGEEAKPTSMNKFTGLSIDFTLELTQNPPPAEVGLSAELSGNYNYQTNQAVADKPVFGYMYSSNASGDVMDYHFEKATNFNKRDVFIGLPASDNDQYIVTGESLSGGFRLHHATSEYFRPNTTYSNTFLYAQGIGVDLGFCFGGGANSTIGYNLLWMKGMSAYQSSFSNPDDTKIDEPVFFRFNNDRGGTLEYGNENILEPTGGSVNLAGDYRSGRSSYIGYNLNKNMATELNDICYYSYCKDNAVSDFINRSEEALADQVGEFSILNEDGMCYTYGLPVYSREELNMSYSISGGTGDTYIKYCETDGEQESKIGEYRSNPYTTSYLLTSINTSDYIDRLNDGPTTDDFGGYTRFVYKRLYGSNNKVKENSSDTSWYKWRIPYTGMYFNRNELSRDVDDLCSVSQGEKETYYLDSIITKTHYAVFYTSERDDGYSASINGDDDTDPTATGGKPLHKLDSIGLFAKNATGDKLLKTVKFSYNYDAFPGLPNSINNDGKLTLEKVWFEYNGIYDAWLSPYEFYYQYPNTDYPDGKYDALENYGSGLNEMPSYSKYILDAWSNYQPNGQARYINMQFWPFQGQQLSSDFDPAAWQLKYIKLPSGGEIHVQYEQDDYCYVQDKYAHALVRLTGNDYSNTSTVFSLDVEYDLNIIDNNVKQEIADLINELYGNYKKRIFFKFLYKLIGNATPVLDNKLSEYLSGYAFVESAYVESDILKIKIGAPDNNAGYYIPGQVCLDYYKANCFGRTAENNDISYNIFSDNNPLAIGYRFLDFLNNFEPPSSSEICMKINPELSYFRIPMVTDKRGGGLRVKRLLMFDNGISGGKPSLYGNEYNYRFYDKALNKWRSSGVTTNEPSAMREENALVNIIERGEQTLCSKLISGRDKKQLEGPIRISYR